MALELEARETARRSARCSCKLADALANAGRGADAAPHYLRAAEQVDGEAAKPSSCGARRWSACCAPVTSTAGCSSSAASSTRSASSFPRRRSSAVARHSPRQAAAAAARPALRKSVRPSSIPQHLLTSIDVCWGVITGLARIDNIRSAYFQPIHLRLALQAGEPYRTHARAGGGSVLLGDERGEGEEENGAAGVARRSAARARIGEPHAIGMSMMARSMESYYLGLFRDSVQQADEAETHLPRALHRRVVGDQHDLEFRALLADVSRRAGDSSRNACRSVCARPRSTAISTPGSIRCAVPGIMWLAADDPDAARRAVRQVMDRWSLQGFHFQHYLEMFAENQTDLYIGNWASAWRRSDERWPLMKSSFLLRIPFVKLEALHLIGRSALAAARSQRRCDADRARRAQRPRDRKRKSRAWAQPFALALRAGVASLRGAHEDSRRHPQPGRPAPSRNGTSCSTPKPPTTAAASSPAAPAAPPSPPARRNGCMRAE